MVGGPDVSGPCSPSLVHVRWEHQSIWATGGTVLFFTSLLLPPRLANWVPPEVQEGGDRQLGGGGAGVLIL